MTRRCSHCNNNGHNSRTCPTRVGVKLFGVRLTDGSIIKKSASMGNLSSLYNTSSSAAGSPNHDSPPSSEHHADGYLSDDTPHGSCSSNRRAERKKGVPWTEDEHKMFLVGLQKLGKGDWRGIARNYVVSRTPTQVASHAQKYFIRQSNNSRRKRRSSLFDMIPDMALDTPTVPEEQVSVPSQSRDTDEGNSQPSLDLSLKSNFEPMETAEEPAQEQSQTEAASCNSFIPLFPGYIPAYMPIPFPVWQPNAAPPEEERKPVVSHQVLKPIPVLPKEPFNVEQLVGMTRLSLGETDNSRAEPSSLSVKSLGEPSRQSAFHVNAPISGSELSKGKGNEIQAI